MPAWRRHCHRLLAVALVAWQVGVSGCRATESSAPPSPPANDFLFLSGMAGNEPVSRGQKDDHVVQSMLEIRPEDPGSRENRTARIRAIVNGEAILDEEVVAAGFQQLV